jgi:hypothetical protein
MKKAVFLVLLFMAVIFTVAAADPVLTVVNDTGYDFDYLYISKSNAAASSEEDVLGDKVLEDGGSFKITLKPGTWDIEAEDEYGDYYGKYDVSITRDIRVVLTDDDYLD